MGATTACKDRSSPGAWEDLVDTTGFGRMRINAGHFGGNHKDTSPGHTWSDEFVSVMGKAPHFYADVGNWDELAAGKPEVINKVIRLMGTDIGHGEQAAQRILFGTDWFMLSKETNWPGYADRIHQHLKTAGATGLELEHLMYRNVLDLYGLNKASPGKNRTRLVDYYAGKGLSPEWLALT